MNNAALLASRAVVEVSGAEARDFLKGLVTNSIETVDEQRAGFAALLSPQGKIGFDFLIACVADGFLLDVDAGLADALVKKLSLYRLRAKITIARREDLGVAAFWGDAPTNTPSGARSFADPRLPALGWRVIGPQAELTSMLGDAGGAEADYQRLRLSLGVPQTGADFAPDAMFLLDVNFDALKGVDYKKGCFVGQEVSSRMKRKGAVRKRTLIASFDNRAPEKGAAVTAGERTLGEIIAATDGAALALIRLDRLAAAKEDGAEAMAGGQPLHLAIPAYLDQG